MRIIAALSKEGRAAYLSHLDLQRTVQRILRRADIPLRYSKGFNPHPELHFATALSTGAESQWEWFDVELEEAMTPEAFLAAVAPQMPEGLAMHDVLEGPDTGFGSLAAHLQGAAYTLTVQGDVKGEALAAGISTLLSGTEWIVEKRTKSGFKPQNIRPQIYGIEMEDGETAPFRLQVTGELTASGGLRPEALVKVLSGLVQTPLTFRCWRTGMYFDGFLGLPSLHPMGKEE